MICSFLLTRDIFVVNFAGMSNLVHCAAAFEISRRGKGNDTNETCGRVVSKIIGISAFLRMRPTCNIDDDQNNIVDNEYTIPFGSKLP